MTPSVAGFLRGLGLAIALASADAAITFLSGNTIATIAPTLAPWQPVILVGLRTIEGMIDHARQSNC